MAARGRCALQRQLEREIKHRAWLETNMAGSAQLVRCKSSIAILAERLYITHKRKERTEARSLFSK